MIAVEILESGRVADGKGGWLDAGAIVSVPEPTAQSLVANGLARVAEAKAPAPKRERANG